MSYVHFILIGGELTPEYQRAILSARVHEKPIILWCTAPRPPQLFDLDIRVQPIQIPTWLTGKQKPHIFDVLAYQIALANGGLVLGLDTISVRNAFDLVPANTDEFPCDIVVSTDWPEEDWPVRPDPFNNNFLVTKKLTSSAEILYDETVRRLQNEPETWGCTGPLLLTKFVRDPRSRIAAAPYPALCGWAPGYIWRFYLGLETPDPETRVIHLCRTAYIELYERRYADWAAKNPDYAGEVARRTDVNERLLRCP